MRRRLSILLALLALPGVALAQTQRTTSLAATTQSATLQSAAVANGNGTAMTVTGMGSVLITDTCTSCAGGTTVNFELSDGTTFAPAWAYQLSSTPAVPATSTTAASTTLWLIPQIGGAKQLRARISSYSAGTITVSAVASPLASAPPVISFVNPRNAAGTETGTSANPLIMAGNATPSDTFANPTNALTVWSLNGCWNTTTTQFQRCTASSVNTGLLDNGTTRNTIATNDPMFGTAGTASAEVLTVQGKSGMTPLFVMPGPSGFSIANTSFGISGTLPAFAATPTVNLGTLNGVALDASVTGLQVAQGSTTSGQKGALMQCAVTTAAPSYTTAQTDPCSITPAGGLRVDPSGVTSPISAASLPLPTGASTAANQATANTSLASIDTKLTSPLTVSRADSLKLNATSYSAAAFIAGSSTTDNAVLPGNATNTVLVTEIAVTCTQTTAGTIHLSIIKRSAADTAGTSAAMTVVPDDSTYAAGVSAPLTYTGTGPTTGAAVGSVDEALVGCNATSTAGPNDIYILNLRNKPIVLRGTAQQLAITANGAITGGNLAIKFKWIETTSIVP